MATFQLESVPLEAIRGHVTLVWGAYTENKSPGIRKLLVSRFVREKTAHSVSILKKSSMEGIFGLNCRPIWATKGRLRRFNSVCFVVFERPKDLETLKNAQTSVVWPLMGSNGTDSS